MKKNLILSFLLSGVLLSFATPALAGLGISPSDWIEPHALAGQSMTKTFVLSRSDTAQDLYFTSEITGDITPWITIENGASFMLPKGQQELPVKVTIAIPANTAFKEYQGEVRLRSQSNAANTGSAPIGVLLSALIQIDLHVSDQPFSDYQVLQITIPDQKANTPLNVVLKIWNQGNTVARPTKLTMDIFDKFNNTQLDSKTFTDFSALAAVPPFSEGTITVPVPFSLPPEQYWAKTNVYQDASIIKSDDLTFNIVNSLPSNPANVGNSWQIVAYIAIGIIVAGLIGLGTYFLVKKLRTKKPKNPGHRATKASIETEVDDGNIGNLA